MVRTMTMLIRTSQRAIQGRLCGPRAPALAVPWMWGTTGIYSAAEIRAFNRAWLQFKSGL